MNRFYTVTREVVGDNNFVRFSCAASLVDIAIFFQKPVKDASGYALTNNSYFTPY
jgi:hypothetical protein